MINNVEVLDRPTYEEARALIASAHLQAIRFVKFALSIDVPEGQMGEDVELTTSGKSSGKASEGGMILSFDLKIVGKKDDHTIIKITGRIEAAYGLPEDQKPTDSQMKAFGKTNGMLNVWPYWREYVQTATLRAGLPPLTLPLFRVMHQQTAK